MTYREMTHNGIDCLLRFPDGYKEGDKCPLLIHVHGAGGRGGIFEEIATHDVFTVTEKMKDFPFIIAAPICPEATATWFDFFQDLKSLVRVLIKSDFTDPERVYVIGGSMGGYTTWELGMSMPECFAAIVPICGGGMYWNAARLVNVPVWAFHGKLDKTVLVEESEKMVAAVNKRGGNAKLTVYPENGHNAWTDTFSNPEVYRWLLSHRNVNAKNLEDEYSGNLKDFS